MRERYQKLETEQRPSKIRYIRSIPPIAWLAIGILFFLVVVIGVIISTNQAPRPTTKAPVGQAIGGAAVFTAPNVFIDNIAIGKLANVLSSLTTNCNIADNVNLPLGSRASTTASWQMVKGLVNSTCDFYGLQIMEMRTGQLEGPLDICYAAMDIGLQIVQVYYNNTLPFDFLARLITLYDIAYPLQLYWKRASLDAYSVSDQALLQISAFITASTSGGDATIYKKGFCNQYFGQDDLNQYDSTFQPWLKAPFEGMLQKLADTVVSNSAQQALGGMTTPSGLDIKQVYAIGSRFIDDASIQLFADSMLGGLQVIVIPDTVSVTDAMLGIKESLYNGPLLNTSAVPVFVFADYTANVPFYNSLAIDSDSIILAFADEQSSLDGLPVNIATTIQSAVGAHSMSVMDFTTTHPYEFAFGPVYSREKFVADLIVHCIGTHVTAASTVSYGLLDTFALKNTAILTPTPSDLGGWLTRVQAGQALTDAGISIGLKPHAFSMQLTQATPAGGNISASEILTGAAPTGPLPSRFRWREKYPQCFPPPTTQGRCNNCWARASSGSISSRACIASGGTLPATDFLSSQHVTSCSQLQQGTNGCNPQFPSTGFSFAEGDVHTVGCMPVIDSDSSAGGCPSQCVPGESLSKVGGIVKGSYIHYDNPTDIKTAIYRDGPIMGGLSVPTDFLQTFPVNTPSLATYIINPNAHFIGGHVMVVEGWDDTTNPPLWYVLNTWDKEECDLGFCKVQQDTAGVYKNSAMWFDTFGWAATPRPIGESTNPTTILFKSSSSTTSQPRVYTSQLGCPTQVLNGNQSEMQAQIQGCPNSAGTLQSTSTTVTSGGHTLNGVGMLTPLPFYQIVMLIIITLFFQ